MGNESTEVQGRVVAMSGPTVTVEFDGAVGMYDQVLVGRAGLQGEVVRLAGPRAVVQVFEDTRGLGLHEPGRCLGKPLSVQLGPGLLGGVFDGLQRPLAELVRRAGPFIAPGLGRAGLDMARSWDFVPRVQPGQTVTVGSVLGEVMEGPFRHAILAAARGTVRRLRRGKISLAEPVAELAGGGRLWPSQGWPVRLARPFHRRLSRQEPLITGQRCIDFLFPLARGGTAILPGGFGTGKTVLEQAIAKFADVDLVVYVGCGERGNEMAEMLDEFAELVDPWSGRRLMERTIMIANTSNMPVAAREASIYTAVTMGEYYRDMGYQVLLLADSISRWAEALREISAGLEEMPGEEGYPTYLASRLAGFFARAGVVETLSGRTGSLSMILSVSPPGGDLTEPVTQSGLRAAGAFLMLDTALAHQRHFPAVNWSQSFSLYEPALSRHFTATLCPDWQELRQECQELLQREQQLREVAEIVGGEGLQELDRLVMHSAERLRREFLCQNSFSDDAFSTPELTGRLITTILREHREARRRLKRGESLAAILGKEGT